MKPKAGKPKEATKPKEETKPKEKEAAKDAKPKVVESKDEKKTEWSMKSKSVAIPPAFS